MGNPTPAAQPREQPEASPKKSFPAKTVSVIATIIACIAALVSIPSGLHEIGMWLFPAPQLYKYAAAAPGPDCDHGGAYWALAHANKVCFPDNERPDRMQLSARPDEGIGQAYFFGTRKLPSDYVVAVDIYGLEKGGCAGVTTRNSDSRAGRYLFEICRDGAWLIAKYSPSASDGREEISTLLSGPSPSKSAYHLSVTCDGVRLSLRINDEKEVSAEDGDFADTESVSLFVAPQPAGDNSATFSKFTFEEVRTGVSSSQ